MRQKRYYYSTITMWGSLDGRERKYILWYDIGGPKRGEHRFTFGDTPEELLTMARAGGYLGTPSEYTGERWND